MDTANYWESRYTSGGTSGAGLCLEFKGRVLRKFILDNNIKSIVDFGCGDGRMINLFNVEDYTGLDISPTIIQKCKELFVGDKSKKFYVYKHPLEDIKKAQLILSLDVIFHLLEDETYDNYMRDLFNHSKEYVIIYSSDTEEPVKNQAKHLRQHKFTDWVKENRKEWKLVEKIDNEFPYNKITGEGAISDFYIYKLQL